MLGGVPCRARGSLLRGREGASWEFSFQGHSRDGLMICHAPSGFRVSDLAGKAVHSRLLRCRKLEEPDITRR
jgi:hypothetical protein